MADVHKKAREALVVFVEWYRHAVGFFQPSTSTPGAFCQMTRVARLFAILGDTRWPALLSVPLTLRNAFLGSALGPLQTTHKSIKPLWLQNCKRRSANAELRRFHWIPRIHTVDKIPVWKVTTNMVFICVSSGFRHEVDENCELLGHYAASTGNFSPTFRDNLSVWLQGSRIQGKKFTTARCVITQKRAIPIVFVAVRLGHTYQVWKPSNGYRAKTCRRDMTIIRWFHEMGWI
jgi:hypothetical protein